MREKDIPSELRGLNSDIVMNVRPNMLSTRCVMMDLFRALISSSGEGSRSTGRGFA
jgi:hypothetical protein